MADTRELVDLARELAEIAGRATDPETSRLLLELVDLLLTQTDPPQGSARPGEPRRRH
jgi:hypothetical protein